MTSPFDTAGLAAAAPKPSRSVSTRTPSVFLRFMVIAAILVMSRAVMPHSFNSRGSFCACSRSSVVSFTFTVAPARSSSTSTSRPTGVEATIWLKTGMSSGMLASVATPLKRTITSPAWMPARAAGESSSTPPTSTPPALLSTPRSCGCVIRPVQLRRTKPWRMISSATLRARLPGIAPPSEATPISLMPMTSPARLASGPPLFPPKITASW